MDEFNFEVKSDIYVPMRIAGHETGVNAEGQPYIIVDGRKWSLANGEPDYKRPQGMIAIESIPAPPRRISLTAKFVMLFLKNEMAIIAFALLCFGMAFGSFIFAPTVPDAIAFWEEKGIATVTRVETTNTRVNGRSICSYHFESKDSEGRTVSGISYQGHGKFKEKQQVPLLRSQFFGEKWKLKDASFAMFGGMGFFIFLMPIFFVIPFGMLLFGSILPGRKQMSLLKNGETANAAFLEMKETSVTVNNSKYMKLFFRFETPEGEPHQATVWSLTPDKVLSDERSYLVFYEPTNPKRNCSFGGVSKILRFDEQTGNFVLTGSRWRLMLLLIFGVVLAAECYWAFQSMAAGKVFFFL